MQPSATSRIDSRTRASGACRWQDRAILPLSSRDHSRQHAELPLIERDGRLGAAPQESVHSMLSHACLERRAADSLAHR